MAIEIVSFPINSMVIFHCKLLVHQAGYSIFRPAPAGSVMGFLWVITSKHIASDLRSGRSNSQHALQFCRRGCAGRTSRSMGNPDWGNPQIWMDYGYGRCCDVNGHWNCWMDYKSSFFLDYKPHGLRFMFRLVNDCNSARSINVNFVGMFSC